MRATITISNLDVTQSLQRLIPAWFASIGDAESDVFAYRLIGNMGNRASDLFLEVVEKLPEEDLQSILVSVIQTYHGTLVEKLNAQMQQHHLMRNLSVGSVSVQEAGTQMLLILDGVSVSYGGLLRDPVVLEKASAFLTTTAEKKVGKLGGRLGQMLDSAVRSTMTIGSVVASFAKNPLDARCVEILEIPMIRESLLRQCNQALTQYGVVAELDDVSFDLAEVSQIEEENAGFYAQLPLATREHLAEVLANALCEHVLGGTNQ